MERQEPRHLERIALTIPEAIAAGAPKRAKLYQEIRSGRLRARKNGRSTIILVQDLRDYLTSLPVIQPAVSPPTSLDPPVKRQRRPQ